MFNWWKNLTEKQRNKYFTLSVIGLFGFLTLYILTDWIVFGLLMLPFIVPTLIFGIMQDKLKKERSNVNKKTIEYGEYIEHGIQRNVYASDYCVVDIETTGFSSTSNKIIEITALRVRQNEIVDMFTSLINPCQDIPLKIQSLTGITNEMVIDAPNVEDVLPKFIEFVANDLIVGHNVKFDLQFISWNTYLLTGKSFLNDFVDTLPLSRRAFPHLTNHKLKTLTQELSLPKSTHRSKADCIATKALYDRLKNI